MNRLWASVFSLLVPIPVAVIAVLLLVLLPPLPRVVYTIGFFAVVALILTLEVHFATWYVKDKGREASLGFLGVFGIFGWLVLWSLEDRGFRFS